MYLLARSSSQLRRIAAALSASPFASVNASRLANVTQHVTCSNPLIHGKVVVAAGGKGPGVVVPLVNWAGTGPSFENLTKLTVTVQHALVKPGMKAMLATGGAVAEVPTARAGPGVSYMLDLDVADALILRL